MTIVYDIQICFNYQRHIVVEASNHSWVKRKHSISKTNLDRKRNKWNGHVPKKSTSLVYVHTIILLRLILKLWWPTWPIQNQKEKWGKHVLRSPTANGVVQGNYNYNGENEEVTSSVDSMRTSSAHCTGSVQHHEAQFRDNYCSQEPVY